MKYVKGDLIKLALAGEFDVVAHWASDDWGWTRRRRLE